MLAVNTNLIFFSTISIFFSLLNMLARILMVEPNPYVAELQVQ